MESLDEALDRAVSQFRAKLREYSTESGFGTISLEAQLSAGTVDRLVVGDKRSIKVGGPKRPRG